MSEKLSMKVPLVDESGKSKGYLFLTGQKRPRDIPRVGEKVVIGGGLEGVVAEVSHYNFFYFVGLTFKPVSYAWRAELEGLRENWEYFE